MAKFIKFTNVRKLFANSQEQSVSEYIINVDEIRSLSTVGQGHDFIIVPKISNSLNPYSRLVSCIIISKEDYENAKKILLEL